MSTDIPKTFVQSALVDLRVVATKLDCCGDADLAERVRAIRLELLKAHPGTQEVSGRLPKPLRREREKRGAVEKRKAILRKEVEV